MVSLEGRHNILLLDKLNKEKLTTNTLEHSQTQFYLTISITFKINLNFYLLFSFKVLFLAVVGMGMSFNHPRILFISVQNTRTRDFLCFKIIANNLEHFCIKDPVKIAIYSTKNWGGVCFFILYFFIISNTNTGRIIGKILKLLFIYFINCSKRISPAVSMIKNVLWSIICWHIKHAKVITIANGWAPIPIKEI